MKKVFLTVVLLCGVGGLFAGEVKTVEQSNDEMMARLVGSSLRIGKADKAMCEKQFSKNSALIQACLLGYDEKDKQLNAPVNQ